MERPSENIEPTTDSANGLSQQAAIHRVLRQFKTEKAFRLKMNKVVNIVGELLTADRCYIFQFDSKQGKRTISQYSEWVRYRIEAQIDNPELYDVDDSLMDEALEYLDRGEVFIADTVNIKDPIFRETMQAQDIESFTFAPIIAQNTMWGFLGVDSCRLERLWTEEDGLILLNFSNLIGNHLDFNHVNGLVSQKNKLLQVAIESSNDGFWYLNIQENKLYFSKQWKDMLGYSENEIDHSFDQLERLIHPDDRELVLAVMDPYIRNDSKAFEYEYRMRHKTKGYIWIMTQAYVKFDENNLPTTLVGTNIDISARVNYQKDLKERQKEYSEIINAVHDVIFQIDEFGVFLFLNPAWSEITGFSVDNSMGTPLEDYIYPNDREKFSSYLKQKKDKGNKHFTLFEMRLLNSQGAFCWVKFSFTIYYDSNGDFNKAQGTITDIHQRKMAEIAQRESEEKFRLMSENMSDLTCLHKADGTFSYVSPSMADMLGYEPELMLGRSSYEFIHPEDKEQVYEVSHLPLLKGIQDKAITTFRLRREDGTYIWAETVTQAIKKGGQLESILSVSRDISERIEVEMEIKKALEKEKELNELKSRFVSMASHEFRTPLTSIKSSIQILEMYAEGLDKKVRQFFEKHFSKMVVQIDRLSDLMNNILVLGRTEADKIPFEPEETDLRTEIEKIIRMDYAPWQDGRTVSVAVQGEERPVFVDINLMGHIVNNILSNAFKYSKDQPSPQLTIHFNSEDFKIEVRDFGIGIPDEEKSQLFQSFFRAENTINIEGTGLGLVILKQFVEVHSGTVNIESEEGKGTTVTVIIPYRHQA
mgnify:CR=1 FL=1